MSNFKKDEAKNPNRLSRREMMELEDRERD